MIEDERLKWKFKSGSAGALQRIYEKYRDYLLTLAMALVNDAPLAEDIVQDVFVVFAQSNGTFKLRGSLKSYLATCTLNRCRDQIRARKRRPLSLDED
ncbi:MAG: RNA polymerase sigma factor, partial [Planctomycetota bacterium]